MSLEGEIAIVTGGAVRVGRAFALSLAEWGAKVVVHYGSSQAEAEETVKEIRSMGGTALPCSADLRHPTDAAEKLFSFCNQELGSASILVNSAAIFEAACFSETSPELLARTTAINFESPFFLSQQFAKQLPEDIDGKIINIVDWRAEKIDGEYLAYSLAKNSLLELTKTLALELAPRVRVNAIAPGAILPPPGGSVEEFEQKAEAIPLKRTGSPDELVRALRYLLEAPFVTGEILHVTGGEHL
ncbi:MAG: SDR family oxidoreductase [Planctomycetaceae bacterium]|nr:SDR family oxidoreductase [Planctomycetaceae bacterium]